MPFPPLRYIHAANVLLDSPVWLPGERSVAHRQFAANATRTAFRNLVRACLDRDVDFLLLCGNTFVEADRSLAARVALRDGLEQLAAAGIPVFVLPGDDDLADAWQPIPELPELVTVVRDGEEPVDVTRDGETIAAVAARIADVGTSTGCDVHPLRIALRLVDEGGDQSEIASSCDYVALGGGAPPGTRKTANGIAHHPGGTQPLSPPWMGARRRILPRSPAGANGSCTLVEVDESRQLHLTQLPTAAIRFERLKKTLDGSDTPGNLLQTLPGKLALRPAANGEQIRCVQWTLDGDGPLWESLQSPASCAEVESELSCDADAGIPAVVHEIEVTRTNDSRTLPDDIADEFQRSLAETPDLTLDDVVCRLDELTSLCPEWKPRTDRLARRLSPARITALANYVGRQRLQGPAEEGWDA